MTRSQFSYVVGADEKWVENSARVLGRRLEYTAPEARWLGLVRLLTRDFGIPLVRAGQLAGDALRHPADTEALVLAASADGVATLVLDLARYHSRLAAALAFALHHGGPRRPGRPPLPHPRSARADPIQAAVRHGVDLGLLRESLRREPAQRLARLDANRAFLRSLRPVMPGKGRARTPLVRVLDHSAFGLPEP